jgi:hypothetical protein
MMVTTLEGVDYPSESKENHTDFSFWFYFWILSDVEYNSWNHGMSGLLWNHFNFGFDTCGCVEDHSNFVYLFIYLIGISLRGAYAMQSDGLSFGKRIISLRGVLRYGVHRTDGPKPAGPGIRHPSPSP